MENTLIIHSDGGSRGNPGPGACAFIAEENGKLIGKGTKFLGTVTNNLAEYQGVILALQWVTRKSPIIFYLDSELVVRQLNGKYKVKNKDLLKLAIEIKNLITEKDIEIVFKNIPREKNTLADLLVNEELDRSVSGNFV